MILPSFSVLKVQNKLLMRTAKPGDSSNRGMKRRKDLRLPDCSELQLTK